MEQMISMSRGYSVDVTRFLDNYMAVHIQKGISPQNCGVDCNPLSASAGRVPILDITPSELEIERAVLGIHHRDFFV